VVPEVIFGAGTVVDPEQAPGAADAGAAFLVSPGVTTRLLDAMADTGLPLLPGCATLTEVLELRERGLTELKLFPAEASGGTAFLRSVHGPLPDVRFCPTGGITLTNAPDYLALANVGCVGGTWLSPPDVVQAGDWARITTLATEAAGLAAPVVRG
jgi:2-dehydro-3-deoxyphosphogluconate aldolase/(4S)-4-hydroxy-2-oxoglutarate aldolase